MTTTALVPVFAGTINGQPAQLCNARDLYSTLEIVTKFEDWITRRIEQYGFIDGEDFFANLRKTRGRPATDYHLTLDMAKELAMVENNERGREVRRYFIQIEKAARSEAAPAHDATATATANHLRRCMMAAGLLGGEAARAFYQTLATAPVGKSPFDRIPQLGRWAIEFDAAANPRLWRIDNDAIIASIPRLTSLIEANTDVQPSNGELANLARACLARLTARLAQPKRRAA